MGRVADLIQEQRAAVGLHQGARPLMDGSRERPFDVARTSSLSMSPIGRAAQCRGTNGPDALSLQAWARCEPVLPCRFRVSPARYSDKGVAAAFLASQEGGGSLGGAGEPGAESLRLIGLRFGSGLALEDDAGLAQRKRQAGRKGRLRGRSRSPRRTESAPSGTLSQKGDPSGVGLAQSCAASRPTVGSRSAIVAVSPRPRMAAACIEAGEWGAHGFRQKGLEYGFASS